MTGAECAASRPSVVVGNERDRLPVRVNRRCADEAGERSLPAIGQWYPPVRRPAILWHLEYHGVTVARPERKKQRRVPLCSHQIAHGLCIDQWD